jgi:MinD-like ATPase involved in chromosome partitioning or flagellar assembly
MEQTRVKVLIADGDEEYALRLENRFLRSLRSHIDLQVFTDYEMLEEFISHPIHIDVALVDEKLLDCIHENMNITELYVLAEEETGDVQTDDGDGHTYVYKYTSLNHVFNRTMGSYRHFVSRGAEGRSTQVITLCSPIGGSGKTTIAVGIASSLQDEGYRVLYIDAEYQQGLYGLFQRVHPASAEAMRAIGNRASSSYGSVKPFIENDTVDVVPPADKNILMFGLYLDDYVRLIQDVVSTSDYDYLVVDTDGTLDKETLSLIGCTTTVVVPILPSEMAAMKTKAFLGSLDIASRKKCHVVCNAVKDQGKAFSFDGLNIELQVAYDERIPTLPSNALSAITDIRAMGHLFR